jgi:hypothetical protein
MFMTPTDVDPQALPLDELRAVRARMQSDDDAISYVRRLAQAKLDLVRAQQRHLARGNRGSITEELPIILGEHLTGGPARPPRPADDFSEHPLALELELLEQRLDGEDVYSMNEVGLAAFAAELESFEHARSQERQELFTQIDALSAELVRRYRDGEADVEGLLARD